MIILRQNNFSSTIKVQDVFAINGGIFKEPEITITGKTDSKFNIGDKVKFGKHVGEITKIKKVGSNVGITISGATKKNIKHGDIIKKL